MSLKFEQLDNIFGSFSYQEDHKRKGAITIDPRWVANNITHVATPFGTFACHRLVAYQMQMFINQGADHGLINDIGGIWVPRHILWNSAKPLSGHSYGCDVDINVDDGKDGAGGSINYGANSYQPDGLIKLATHWGFEWGGAWRNSKDGMHFSCIRVISSTKHNPIPIGLPALSVGSRGVDVIKLQTKLHYKGYRLKVDGIFGPKTAAALTDWQRKCGFKVTGQTDTETWETFGGAA